MFLAAPIALSDGPEDRGALMFQIDGRRLGLHLSRIQGRTTPVETVLVGGSYRILGQDPWIEATDYGGSPLDAMVRLRRLGGGEGAALLGTESGDRVLAAWTPIPFEGLSWVVLTTIDTSAVWTDGVSERRVIALIAWLAGAVLSLGRRRPQELGQHHL